MSHTVRAEQAQGATFVELFFDLVFVFAVTQIAGVLHEDLTASGVLRALLVFWLVWWAWTQFTWTLNAADTTHPRIRATTLAASATAFLMALAVPDVFGAAGWWFALSYITVRLIGIAGQYWVSSGDAEWSSAVRTWSTASLVGLAAVAVAMALPPAQRPIALGVTIALDMFSAWRAGTGEWRLFPSHFAERHGLFVIIALGESLIAAGAAAGDQPPSGALAAAVVLAVAASCALWWTYFGWANDALEEAMHRLDSLPRGWFGRDVYSLLHFPIICGVVGFAVAIEEAVHHPADPLHIQTAAALTGGAVLFVGGMAAALLRARSRVPVVRIVAAVALLAATPLLTVVPATAALAFVAAVVTTVAALERPPAGAGQQAGAS